MPISLKEFEQQVDETILLRGYSYFKNGKVQMVEEISTGCYQATVAGSELYEIELKIEKGNITEHNCDCPYDMGEVCKHIVAVIFYLQKEELDLQTKSTSKKSSIANHLKKNPKRKTVEAQINELLEKISTDDLKQFIREKSSNDDTFRNLFLSAFAFESGNESKEMYAKQVKSILNSASKRDGFIDWSAVKRVGKSVGDILKLAEKHLAKDNFKSTIFICFAVMEQMTPALQYADDSNADIGGNIDWAYTLLHKVVEIELSEPIRIDLLHQCFSAFEKKIFSGWDWHLGMMNLAVQLIKTKEEEDKIIAYLDDSEWSEFEHERAQEIKWQVLKRRKGDEAAEKIFA